MGALSSEDALELPRKVEGLARTRSDLTRDMTFSLDSGDFPFLKSKRIPLEEKEELELELLEFRYQDHFSFFSFFNCGLVSVDHGGCCREGGCE